jgi:tight adherence protein B
MNTDPDLWLGSLLMGLAVTVLSYSGREYFAGGLDAVERELADQLRRLRASTRNLRKYLIIWLIVIAATFFGFWIGLDSLILAVPLSVFLVAAPWYLLHRMAERRREQIEDQLADAMVSLASAVKAGLSLSQALEILASQCPRPISDEFHQMVAEYKMGKPLQQTLTEAKERLRSENFTLLAAAVLASHECGGRLNETVERIAYSVREMQRLRRKVQSETAQARKSAVYMALAPALILLAYYFIDQENTTALLTEPIGQLLLVIAAALDVVAYLWARIILNPDI